MWDFTFNEVTKSQTYFPLLSSHRKTTENETFHSSRNFHRIVPDFRACCLGWRFPNNSRVRGRLSML
ncbi:UNVERIFIED_CONTAM: hypothetical protein RMT77_001102 [Armadillidium vulgare]